MNKIFFAHLFQQHKTRKGVSMRLRSLFVFMSLMLCLSACKLSVQQAEPLHRQARMFPDYAATLLPINMSAPTFALCDSTQVLTSVQAVFRSGSETIVVGSDGDEEGICIAADDWRQLTQASHRVEVTIQGKTDNRWVEYDPFVIEISPDTIDPYLVYRLIEPGYEVWNEMGIYQRHVEDYDESPIITNAQTETGCMNCHSFCNYDPDKMMFHLRLNHAGTYLKGSTPQLRRLTSPRSLVYPSWHPSGRFIAFSQNDTKQMFHTTDRNRIEVFDFSSDIVVYDLAADTLITSPLLSSNVRFETFPAWSADGQTLYFCSADSVKIPDDYDKAHYSLCSIHFDPEKKRFADTITTIYDAQKTGKSVSFPRCSPDGKHLVFTLSNYGNFSIWHRESRLMMLPIDGIATAKPVSLLPHQRASYHSWSSNSRWMVMASRQDDGLYTRPYIVHIDAQGKASKPFLLPQVDAAYYHRQMTSYNIPEFVRGRVSSPQLDAE